MTRIFPAICIFAGSILCGTVAYALTAAPEQARRAARIHSNDEQLRRFAIASPTPAYPRASLEKKIAGVVVAAIRIDSTGVPEAAEILQSPDADTGRAVRDAIMKWNFRPIMGLAAEGKLVFYFHMNGRRGVVLSPAEMREVINPGVKDVKREDEPSAKLITDREFRGLSTRPGPVLLDIRDRETFAEGHEKGAVNIPLGEILARGPAELPASRHIVIDCRDTPDACAVAAHQLTSSGFKQVSILRR